MTYPNSAAASVAARHHTASPIPERPLPVNLEPNTASITSAAAGPPITPSSDISAFVSTLQIGDLVKLKWRYRGDEQIADWLGEVYSLAEPEIPGGSRGVDLAWKSGPPTHQIGKGFRFPYPGVEYIALKRIQPMTMVTVTPPPPQVQNKKSITVSAEPPRSAPSKKTVAKPATPTVESEPEAEDHWDLAKDTEDTEVASVELPVFDITASQALDVSNWPALLGTDPRHVDRLMLFLTEYFRIVDATRPFSANSRNKNNAPGLPKGIKFIKDDMLKSLRAFAYVVQEHPSIADCAAFRSGVQTLFKRLVFFKKVASGQSLRLAIEFCTQVDNNDNPDWITKGEKRAALTLKATTTKSQGF